MPDDEHTSNYDEEKHRDFFIDQQIKEDRIKANTQKFLEYRKNKKDKEMEENQNEIPACTTEGCENPAMMRKDGSRPVTGKCIECHKKIIREGMKKRKKAKKARKAKPIQTNLVISFADYQQTLEALHKAGKAHVRSPEQQGLYYIIEGLNRDEISQGKKINHA